MEGADLVVGNRLATNEKGVMPWHHKYIGNPFVTSYKKLFSVQSHTHSLQGVRAITRDKLTKLNSIPEEWSLHQK